MIKHVTVLNLTLVNTCTCMSESMKENFLCTHLHLPKSRPFFNVYLLTNGRGATQSPSC